MATVVVQRGHVPRTSGATGAPGEQQFAIDTAATLAPLLRDMGHAVRVIDADEPRGEYAGDVFVAIHYDSSGSESASGASVGWQNERGRQFARAWKRAYVAEGWSRGFRPDNYTANLGQYYGVREALAAGNRAAIITESGFHTNPGDRALMTPTRTARSIARAVAEITGTEFDMPTAKEIVDELMSRKVGKADTDMDGWTFQHVVSTSALWALQTRRIIAGQADDIAAAIIEQLPPGGPTVEAVEAAIRRVFGSLDDEEPTP